MNLFSNIAFWSLIFGTSLLTGPVGWLTMIPLSIMALNVILEKTLIARSLHVILSAAAMVLQPALIIPMALISFAMKGLEYVFGSNLLGVVKSGLESALGASTFMFVPMAPALSVAAVGLAVVGGISFALVGGALLLSAVFRHSSLPSRSNPSSTVPNDQSSLTSSYSHRGAQGSSYTTNTGLYPAVATPGSQRVYSLRNAQHFREQPQPEQFHAQQGIPLERIAHV